MGMMVQMVFFVLVFFNANTFAMAFCFIALGDNFIKEKTFAFHLSRGFHAIQHFIPVNIKCNETSLFIYFAICELCYFSFFKQTGKIRCKDSGIYSICMERLNSIRFYAIRFDACMDRISMQSNNLKYLDQFFIRNNSNKCPKKKVFKQTSRFLTITEALFEQNGPITLKTPF